LNFANESEQNTAKSRIGSINHILRRLQKARTLFLEVDVQEQSDLKTDREVVRTASMGSKVTFQWIESPESVR
jgi:hypothetical protein